MTQRKYGVNRIVLSVAFILGSLSSCSEDARRGSSVRTGTAQMPVQGCEATAAEDIVGRFIDSFNKGDVSEANTLIATGERFKWYSVGKTGEPGSRLEKESEDRAGLVRFLRARWDIGERLALKAVLVSSYSEKAEGTNVSFEMMRTAPDLDEGGVLVLGKGLVDCEAATMLMISY